MKSKKEIEIFRVPIRYFDEFEHRLFNKLHEEMLPKKTGFKISYQDAFEVLQPAHVSVYKYINSDEEDNKQEEES